jgi:N-succinyldiaminopimelate aminotransferase
MVPNPELTPIVMSVGEPQDAPPPLLAETVAAHAHLWNRYPPAVGTPEFRRAAAGYLDRRYEDARGRIDPDVEISPVTSSREGLYLAASIATGPSRVAPLAVMQNPFYQTYRAAAIMAGATPCYLPHNRISRVRPGSRFGGRGHVVADFDSLPVLAVEPGRSA